MKREVDKYKNIITYQKRQYSWTYHVLDALAAQIKAGYKVTSPQAFLTSRLKASKVDYPLNFDKPIDILFREKKTKEDLTRAVVLKDKIQKDSEDEIFAISMKYSKMLNEDGKKHYTDLVRERAPLLAGIQLDFEIADLISIDLKNKNSSEIFKYLDQSKLEVQKLENKSGS